MERANGQATIKPRIAKRRVPAPYGHPDTSRSSGEAEQLNEIDAVVRLFRVQADHQRIVAVGVEVRGDIEGVRLVRIVHQGMEVRVARTRLAGLRNQRRAAKRQRAGGGHPQSPCADVACPVHSLRSL